MEIEKIVRAYPLRTRKDLFVCRLIQGVQAIPPLAVQIEFSHHKHISYTFMKKFRLYVESSWPNRQKHGETELRYLGLAERP